MIPLYQAIGKIVLTKENFNSLPEKDKKLFIVKQYCNELDNYQWSKKVNDKVETYIGRLLELNLDTNKKECYFTQGTELSPEKKDELLVFTNYAPHDPSIYASHISLKPLLQFGLYQYVNNYFKKFSLDRYETRGRFFKIF